MNAPEVLIDRPVVLLATAGTESGRLRVTRWLGPRGDDEYGVAIEFDRGNALGVGSDAVAALDDSRRQLEELGVIPGVVGAERNAASSRMSRQMSGGMRVYRTSWGRAADPASLADTFAPSSSVVTLAEQSDYERQWLRSTTILGRLIFRTPTDK